jgi:aminoglycoside 3-N-acetyltransferase I
MRDQIEIVRLTAADGARARSLNSMFGRAFDECEIYNARPPTDEQLRTMLGKEHIIVLAALAGGEIVGGLVAYELDKLEQARREVYIYDLAVEESFRRRGIATALIEELRPIARERGAWVIFVQAAYGDEPALALYRKIGTEEQVLHFDVPV